MNKPKVHLDGVRVVRLLATLAALLVAVSVLLQVARHLLGRPSVFGLVQLLNLDSEDNISVAFSVLLLLIAASALALITAVERSRGSAYVAHWAGLAVGFLFMAADEGISLHEKLDKPAVRILQEVGITPSGVFAFAWVIPAMVGVAILGIVYVKFLRALPHSTRKGFMVAGVVFLSGAIGVEMLTAWIFETQGAENFRYSILAHLEEALEMFGVILLIRAALAYMASEWGEFQIDFVGRRAAHQQAAYGEVRQQ